MYSNLIMLIRIIFIFIIISISSILCFGCSILGGSKSLVPYSQHESWTKITKKDSSYLYEYACNNSSIRVRDILIGGWGFIGPPLIPVIPMQLVFTLGEMPPIQGKNYLLFDIHISTHDRKLPDEPIALELLIPSQKQSYLPVDIIYVQKDFSVIDKEGLHGVDFIISEEGKKGMTYLYKFDLDKKDVEEFEIIFLSGLNGCSIPNISYKQKRRTIYEPFLFMPRPD